jgi:hypothetical protein
MNEKMGRDAGILDKGVLNTEDICAMAWQQRNEKAQTRLVKSKFTS